MKKLIIKVIKRRDAEANATATSLASLIASPTSFAAREEAGAKLLRRSIDSTVSSWITESRENIRIEKDAAVRKMLNGDMLLAAV